MSWFILSAGDIGEKLVPLTDDGKLMVFEDDALACAVATGIARERGESVRVVKLSEHAFYSGLKKGVPS